MRTLSAGAGWTVLTGPTPERDPDLPPGREPAPDIPRDPAIDPGLDL